ncbi:hypothetical protein DEJ23_00090 [Curtobacterium sp. MCSS17_008]|uniref:ComEA family DNA-binding protein n=1 Tax=Curtobacterium sp. MCSS17_008 TaxID=2175647 RepID=UPI000DA7E036|nr:ComEA family DNA-binding protein [Curtobacterium sp. MCSS17_008]PZF59498.1 hypothetical protein DEJ23_00090 [Curtobacterium sp. MCSS17_008]
MSHVEPPVVTSSSSPGPSRSDRSSPSPEPDPRWSRWALTPRAAVVLAAVVVTVALVVVAVGTLGARSSGGVTVTSGPSVAGTPGAAATGPAAGRSRDGADGRAASDGPGASASASSSPSVVAVYVLGAVARAGVVDVPDGTRVDAVLERAGGATADADLARLNLARPVVDGERLYVPRVDEPEVPEALGPDVGGATGSGSPAGSGTGSPAAGADSADSVVDLNAADQVTLETLPGIGPALAARILAWREEHGGFSSVEDLLEVSGIGDGRFAELRDRVRV